MPVSSLTNNILPLDPIDFHSIWMMNAASDSYALFGLVKLVEQKSFCVSSHFETLMCPNCTQKPYQNRQFNKNCKKKGYRAIQHNI